MSSTDAAAQSKGNSSEDTDQKLALPNIPEEKSYSIKRYQWEQLYHLMNTKEGNKAANHQSALLTQECLTKLVEAGIHDKGDGQKGTEVQYPQKIQVTPLERSITPPTTDGEHRLPKA